MTKMDLRKRKTQLSLERALLKLLKKKKLNEIQITELTELAMVSRQTYYLHYEMIEDLYDDCLHRVFNEIHKDLSAFYENGQDIDQEQLVINVFTVYYHHREDLKILFKISDKDVIINNIFEHYAIYNIFTDEVVNDERLLKYAKMNFAGGFYTMLRNWIMEDDDLTPEVFSGIYLKVLHGIKSMGTLEYITSRI